MTEWQPMDTAPKDGTNILVFCDGSIHFSRYCIVSDSARARGWSDGWYGSASVTYAPTHWMPLPKASD
jgi:hypothetical protein